jgi:hypothetical protein
MPECLPILLGGSAANAKDNATRSGSNTPRLSTCSTDCGRDRAETVNRHCCSFQEGGSFASSPVSSLHHDRVSSEISLSDELFCDLWHPRCEHPAWVLPEEQITERFPQKQIRKGAFRLKVEVVSASTLGKPAYRLGDITRNFTKSFSKVHNNEVYAKVRIGKKQHFNTRCVPNVDGSNEIKFPEDKMLFHFHGEQVMSVEVYEHRRVHHVRGDPLIGAGHLTVQTSEICDGHPRCCSVPISRSKHDAGAVMVRFQVVERPEAW